MRPNDWFELACRVPGMWKPVRPPGMLLAFSIWRQDSQQFRQAAPLLSYLAQAIGSSLVGKVLLLGAPATLTFSILIRRAMKLQRRTLLT